MPSAMAANLPRPDAPTAATAAPTRGYPAPVTYATRCASAQPRQDPGRRRGRRAWSRTAKGVRARRRRRGRRRRRTAASSRPLLSTLGFTGKAGEVAKVPTGGRDHVARCWSWSASASEPRSTPAAVRRAAGVAARARRPTPPRSRWRCPPTTREQVRAVDRGHHARRLHVHRLQVAGAGRPQGPARSSCSADAARTQGRRRGLRGRPRSSPRPSPPTRDWVNTPPGDLTPPMFADAVAAREHKGRRPPRSRSTVLDETQLRRARLRRHPRRRRRARPPRRGWSS